MNHTTKGGKKLSKIKILKFVSYIKPSNYLLPLSTHALKNYFFSTPAVCQPHAHTHRVEPTAARWNVRRIPPGSNDLICTGSESIDIMAQASRYHHVMHSTSPFTVHFFKGVIHYFKGDMEIVGVTLID